MGLIIIKKWFGKTTQNNFLTKNISVEKDLESKKHSPKYSPQSKKKIYCKRCKKYTDFYNKEIWFREHYIKLHNPMHDSEVRKKYNPSVNFKEVNENFKKGIFPKDWHKKSKEGHRKADVLITEQMEVLEKQGFRIIPLGRQRDIEPDIIAMKDGKVYAVEVESGQPNFEKYGESQKYFDDVYWVLKKFTDKK